MGAWTRRLLLPLACCFLVSFSFPCGLDIDGHGNSGDETMTVALSSDASLTSLSAYGYRPDGQAWTWGANTAPLYSLIYGPVVNAVAPLRRLEAALLVSRGLGGVALYLLAVALMQLVWRKPVAALPPTIQLLILAFVAFVFINSPRFRFIASFARVDMLGFFFLAAALAACSWMLLAPRAGRVFLFTLLSLSTAWTSYVAFYLVAFVAAAALLIAAREAAKRPSLLRAAGSVAGNVASPAFAAVLVFLETSSLVGGGLQSGPASGGVSAMVRRLHWFATAPEQIQALARPERWLFLAAGLCGLVAVSAWSVWRRRDPREGERPAGHVWTLVAVGVALAALAVVYRFWMATLGGLPIRFTYDVMITTAFGFLQLIVCSYIARNWRAARYVMAGAIAVTLLYVTMRPWEPSPMLWLRCHDDIPLTQRKLWPVRPLAIAFYNPFNDSREPGNRARRLHLAAARDYLLAHDAESALATDPMFAVLSDRRLSFVFLNDSGTLTPSPGAEETLMARVVAPKKIQYIVSSDFGQAEELERAGFAALRSCLRHAAGVDTSCTFGTSTVQFTRVFRTDEAVRTPGAYSYADESSTPLTIYKITLP